MNQPENEATTMARGRWALIGLLVSLVVVVQVARKSDADVEAHCPALRLERDGERLELVAFAVSGTGKNTGYLAYVCPASAPIDCDAVLEHHHRPVGGTFVDLPSPSEHCWLLYDGDDKYDELIALPEGDGVTRMGWGEFRVTKRATAPGDTVHMCFQTPAHSGRFEIVGLLDAEYCGAGRP